MMWPGLAKKWEHLKPAGGRSANTAQLRDRYKRLTRQNVKSGTSENVVYILALRASNAPHDLDYYVGETCNFERRYKNHNNLNSKAGARYTRQGKEDALRRGFIEPRWVPVITIDGFPVHELPGGRKKYFRKKFEFRLRHTCNQLGHCVRSGAGGYIPFRHRRSASRLANQLSTVLKGWRKDYPNHNLTSWLWSDQVPLTREATMRDEMVISHLNALSSL